MATTKKTAIKAAEETKKETAAPKAEAKKEEEKVPAFKYRAPTTYDYSILLHNVLTEKTQRLSVSGNVITLNVVKDANKTAIKDAVQAVFGVKVKKVNTVNVPTKKRSARRGYKGAYKKAYVFVDKAYDLGKIANAVAAPERKK